MVGRFHVMIACTSAIVFACTNLPAEAADVIVPGSLTNTEGSGSSAFPFANGGRTMQFQIVSSALGLSVGDLITGLTFRMDSISSSSPASNFSDYTIVLAAAANALGSMSTTYAANMISPQTVRTGALSLTAGAFPGGSSPNAFGTMLTFTSSYAYQGGDLVVYLTHTPASAVIPSVDAVLTTDSTNGYGTSFRAFSSNSANATTRDSIAHFPVLKFQVVPEPSSLILTASAAIAIACATRHWRNA